MNMFGHAGISKRVHFYATKQGMPALRRFMTLLEWEEAEIFPIASHFSARSVKALLPRWREGVLYARTVADLARGAELADLEEKYLGAGRA